MKKIILLNLIFASALIVYPQKRLDSQTSLSKNSSIPTYSVLFNPTNYQMHLNNLGALDWENFLNSANYYNNGQYRIVGFDNGLWVVGKYAGEPRLALVEWGSQYSPGPIINGRPAMDVRPQDSARFRAYKISRGDNAITNRDYAEWPSDLGAPLSQGQPRLYGDQTVWMVYNADDTTAGRWRKNKVYLPPLPLEIHQTVYGFDHDSLLSNVVFLEWKIINKGVSVLDSGFVSLWSDIDFCSTAENIPAVDTIDQLGYCWNKKDEPEFGWSAPPAVGYTLLYGPEVPSSNDTAVVENKRIPGKKNLPLSSSWGFSDDSFAYQLIYGPAWDVPSAWNNARGLTPKGLPIIDSVTRRVTKFPFSGNPVDSTGWLFDAFTSGGAGINLFSGPFTMQPGDTQWVLVAFVVGVGSDRFSSIDQLKSNTRKLRALSYSQQSLTTIGNGIAQQPTNFILFQNYPNPFNPSTTIEYALPAKSIVRLQIFNVLGQRVTTLYDGEQAAGYQEVLWNAAVSSGIYFYRIDAVSVSNPNIRFMQVKKMLVLK